MAALLEICSHVEQRAVTRFLSNEGARPSEIYRRMKAQYGDSSLKQNRVFKWANSFKEGRTSVQDEPRSGSQKRLPQQPIWRVWTSLSGQTGG